MVPVGLYVHNQPLRTASTHTLSTTTDCVFVATNLLEGYHTPEILLGYVLRYTVRFRGVP